MNVSRKIGQGKAANLTIGGLKVKQGLLLVKPSACFMVVEGVQDFTVGGESFPTLRMRRIDNSAEVHNSPIAKLKNNGIRLPASSDEILKAFKGFFVHYKKQNAMWHKKIKEYNELLAIGDLPCLVELLSRIYYRGKGREFSDVRNEVNFNENQIGEKVISLLGQELDLAFDVGNQNPENIIHQLIVAEKREGHRILSALIPKTYQPYLNDEEIANYNKGTKLNAVESNISLQTPAPVSQFPAVVAERANMRRSEVEIKQKKQRIPVSDKP